MAEFVTRVKEFLTKKSADDILVNHASDIKLFEGINLSLLNGEQVEEVFQYILYNLGFHDGRIWKVKDRKPSRAQIQRTEGNYTYIRGYCSNKWIANLEETGHKINCNCPATVYLDIGKHKLTIGQPHSDFCNRDPTRLF